MKNYNYQNSLINKKQLRYLLGWSFTNYDSMEACSLADELKYLGFKYASQAGISISLEDLKVPFVKTLMIQKADKEILNSEKLYLKGKITDVERFQKIIDTWNLTSEALKTQVVYYFKNYDPLNSVYMMAFSGARGNLSQVRQLVGMRGLMSDPSGEIMKLPIKKNFREGLTITDYLMSGYGARKGIVDTALKTANSGYLTRRLIDVAQDILIREKDCLTKHSLLFSISKTKIQNIELFYDKILGRILNKPIFNLITNELIANTNTQITPTLINVLKKNKITKFYIRSPLSCNLYRAVCQKCYGWDLANENLIDIGEAIGILAGQSIGEPGTQLTMRTFHTGGIFTSGTREQIISPIKGLTKFSKLLKTVTLRTNRGEDVQVTKNSGFIVIIPDNKLNKLKRIKLLRNTILFPQNNQYIQKDIVIGEIINKNKQIRNEIKPIIISNTGGEAFIPPLNNKLNIVSKNKLIWILDGELYNSPATSFLNFYPDFKINKNSYIFRTKLINHYSGYLKFLNKKKNLYQRVIETSLSKSLFFNCQLKILISKTKLKSHILNFKNSNYITKFKIDNLTPIIDGGKKNKIGSLITNSFKTLIGGICYYSYNAFSKYFIGNKRIHFYMKEKFLKFYQLKLSKQLSLDNKKQVATLRYKTIIWLEEETHQLNCEKTTLLVDPGDFISKDFEFSPNKLSKITGIVNINQKQNVSQIITIKSGFVYEGKEFKNTNKFIYYPGEIILSNIQINQPCICEHITGDNTDQLLVRPLKLYEVSNIKLTRKLFLSNLENHSDLKCEIKKQYNYKSNQIIKSNKTIDLINYTLNLKATRNFNNHTKIKLVKNEIKNCVEFKILEKYNLNNYIPAYLKYKQIKSCFLIQQNQFMDQYTVLGYLEAITIMSVEIVKFKIKYQRIKQILLISNENCVTVIKNNIIQKTINNLIIDSQNLIETGKILINNKNSYVIQKGRPYFFPNCNNENIILNKNLQYKILSLKQLNSSTKTLNDLYINFCDINKFVINKRFIFNKFLDKEIIGKIQFSKFAIKKQGKLYSCLIPRFLKKFKIGNYSDDFKFNNIIISNTIETSKKQKNRNILLQNSEIINNQIKHVIENKFQLTLVKFLEYNFKNSAKSIGLYSITEDYFEQDVNNLFCKNNEFVEKGETIGFLNFEKEITGDIVQGLPRIEEILEARKKNLKIKKIPTNQKKYILTQKSSLDPNFEFKKLGTPIKENEKINPHKLLKVYFNYYGLMKLFFCDKYKLIKTARLIKNFENCYKSFKKVQLFILNSVQGVYISQGVSINDKHLEVIIKQMTTKVLITSEGSTPLLRREVIDLYHIQYINDIIIKNKKEPAYYVPLLLGITKAALNNPSFISAASFQETTRVLTKAAIEGRIDWLRGLKENIIIGHLIPTGTGSPTYRYSFKKALPKFKNLNNSFDQLPNIKSKD